MGNSAFEPGLNHRRQQDQQDARSNKGLNGYKLPMPAVSSTNCRGSRYWRTNACQHDSAPPSAPAVGGLPDPGVSVTPEAMPGYRGIVTAGPAAPENGEDLQLPDSRKRRPASRRQRIN
jgi:hypothetical protein